MTGNIPAFTYEKDGRTVSCPYDRAGAMRLSVKDSGAGLSTEELARIFGEGVQFNANALQAGQGSGLGLFITKGIIEKHQGTIKVHSDGLGQGTTFTVELPLFSITSQSVAANIVGDAKVFPNNEDCKQADCANLAKNRSSPLEVLTQYPLNDVLVVDDTVSNRKMLIRLLNNRGCSCIEAGHGQEALVRFDERKTSVSADHEPFDAILMDYEMPIMNGPQATKELRERGFEGFIVGITGNVLPSDIQFFKDNGANIVLPKPLEIELLLQEWNIFKNKYCRISSRTEDIIIMNPRFSRNTFLDLHTEDYD